MDVVTVYSIVIATALSTIVCTVSFVSFSTQSHADDIHTVALQPFYSYFSMKLFYSI